MNKEETIGLAGAYGFILIEPIKNPYMLSFRQEEEGRIRINVYFTTGTVTIQGPNQNETHRGVDLYQFEDLLQKNK